MSAAAEHSVHLMCGTVLRACGTYGEHFSDLEFFLLPSLVHARPPAGNGHRWATLLLVTFRKWRRIC